MVEYVPIFTIDQCNQIIDLYKDQPSWYKGTVGPTGNESSTRIVQVMNIINNSIIFNLIQEQLDNLGEIKELFLMRYGVGGKYDEHIDSLGKRVFSFSIPLNTGKYTGGELFIENTDTLQDNGKAIVFRSNVLHGVKPVIEGTRYVIVGWIHKNKNERYSII